MKGISYEVLFARHLKDSKSLTIEDPYIRENHQIRNLFEFLEMFYKMTPEGEESEVHLVTVKDDDPYKSKNQEEDLNEIVNNFETSRVKFSFNFSEGPLHARSIQTDTGWKISLDRGLDIFQQHEFGRFNLAVKLQEERLSKKFEITYLKI